MTAVILAMILGGLESPVPIVTRIDTDMFPETWVMGGPKATATSLPDSERQRSLRVVSYALDKYPSSILKDNLKKVYIVQSLEFYGLPYGGTNSNDTVYLSNQGIRNGYTNGYLEQSFHHEFSSILLRNRLRSFPKAAWRACNDPDTPYQGNGTLAVRNGTADTRYREYWQERGFLAEYATASIEEDFNMMAGGLLTGEPQFWRAVEKYPRIKQKADLLISFYHELDSSLTENAFRKMKPVD